MSTDNEKGQTVRTIKPIKLYDHLPGILAGYPAVLFLLLSVLSLPGEAVQRAKDGGTESWWPGFLTFDSHMLFWLGLSVMIVWYIAFRFNLPKSKFWLAFGLLGTFVGIPVVLEITGVIKPFTTVGQALGHLAPEINSSAFFIVAVVFFVIWLGNFIWSRTHLRVRIDESGLTINRVGGKGERFDLIGLKTENEPLDYLELFIGGIGSLSLKTRMNKPIFTMKRVFGLYRIPIFPFFKSKLARIEEMLTYQGKVLAVDPRERAEMINDLDTDEDAELDQSAGEDDASEVEGADEGADEGGGENEENKEIN